MKSKGFTPVIDTIKDDVGRTPALVYGVMYRFSRMSELRICTARQSKIANVAGVSRDTVIKAQKILQEAGYIQKAGYVEGGTITWACNVTITGQIEMFVEEGGVAKNDRVVAKNDTLLKKEVVKKQKQGDILDFMLEYGQRKEIIDDTWMPVDVKDYLVPFLRWFLRIYKREPTKSERGLWILEAREWWNRNYLPENVQSAIEHCMEQGTAIKSPRSITWAFDQLSNQGDEYYGEAM